VIGMQRRAWLAAIALLALVGCASREVAAPQTGKAGVTLKGSVAYRERMTLPAGAVVDVWVADTSPGIVAAVLLAETSVKSEGRQVPIPFEVRYDAARVQTGHTYGVRAAIKVDGNILFASKDAVPLTNPLKPADIELVLVRQGSN
jgi:putative lipoprotein